MTTDAQPPQEAPPPTEPPPPAKPRIAKIVRWAARLTSLPVLALVLIALLPTLSHFSVSARDDKLIAIGLCAVCLGLLAGWRWPALGGGLSLVGIGVVLAHEDSPLIADPFSIAFTLQAILFLVSAVLGFRSGKTAGPSFGWLRSAAVGLLAICAVAGVVMICRGPGPQPLPLEKDRYVGVWDSGSGLSIDITKAGEAKVSQAATSTVQVCNSPVKPGETKVFNAVFRGDEHLELESGVLGESKVYLIEQRPHLEGKRMKMALNASEPYHRTNRMVLVKQAPAK